MNSTWERMRLALLACLTASALAGAAWAAEFGHKDGPAIENVDEINQILREDPYSLEVLISFGNSNMGSAGHLAVAVRGLLPADDLVFSANFYADRDPKHAEGYYTGNLMCIVPKMEYLFATTSSLGPDASFGLDMGEIFKRSVIGVRIYGVPKEEVDGIVAFCHRLNTDFHAQEKKTDYYGGPVVYSYMDLNCAKTVAWAFKHGAGWDIKVKGVKPALNFKYIQPLTANLPTDTALRIIQEASRRGHAVDVVLYKKWLHSTYVNPHDEGNVPYKDVPNRFPSVLSLDYKEGKTSYEDQDNLYAMNLLYQMGKYIISMEEGTHRLRVEAKKDPMPYAEADRVAKDEADKASKNFFRRIFRAFGIKLFGKENDNSHLYDYKPEDAPAAPEDAWGSIRGSDTAPPPAVTDDKVK